jgi:uncharacterized protein
VREAQPVKRTPSRQRGAEFLVNIAALSRAPGSRREVAFKGLLDELSVSGSAVPDGEPLDVDLTLESVSEGILVTGTITTRYVGECRRCLAAAEGQLVIPVRELCVEDHDEEDETTYPLRPDLLDLAPIVHDACILALPLAPLCSEECLGLCPECGANRNFEQCSCEPQRDGRWGALALLEGSGPAGRDETTDRP